MPNVVRKGLAGQNLKRIGAAMPAAAPRVQPQPAGSSTWIEVPRSDYNYFVHRTAIGPGALQVRITANSRAVLQDTLPEPQGGLLVAGTGQFP